MVVASPDASPANQAMPWPTGLATDGRHNTRTPPHKQSAATSGAMMRAGNHSSSQAPSGTASSMPISRRPSTRPCTARNAAGHSVTLHATSRINATGTASAGGSRSISPSAINMAKPKPL